MAEVTGKLAGWPFDNYAVNLRRWDTGVSGTNAIVTSVAINTPRPKFTFVAQFNLGPGVISSATNSAKFLEDETLYSNLKAVDLPKPKFATDTLRSYNRNYKLQRKIEYDPFTMRFYDDSTSMVMGLVKDMLNFVNWSGGIGGDRRTNTDGSVYMSEFNKFSHNHTGVSALAQNGTGPDTIRSQMETRPSLGMKLRECGRVFFESIIIYDLGTEPDSINIYTYYNPVLVMVDPGDRDQTERTAQAEVTLGFEYEDYSFSIGQPKNAVRGFIDSQIMGTAGGSPKYPETTGHAIMEDLDGVFGVDPACLAGCSSSGGVSVLSDSTGVVLARDTLGNFVGSANTSIENPDGSPGITRAVDPVTGNPIGGLDFGNDTGAALTYYQDQLDRAQTSYDRMAASGILSPQVLQYRRQQIGTLQQQIAALTIAQTGVAGGTGLAAGTSSALLNTASLLIATGGIALNANQADVQSVQNLIMSQTIIAQRTALFQQAAAEDQARLAALAEQSLSNSPAQNAQLAETAEFHRVQAEALRQQAGALSLPPLFPIYAPANYNSGGAGGFVSAITQGVIQTAINGVLSGR